MGDSYVGVEHAFLAMIRRRDTVPARALAGLVDLDTLEAAVLEAKNAAPGGAPDDSVFLPEGSRWTARCAGQSSTACQRAPRSALAAEMSACGCTSLALAALAIPSSPTRC